MKPGALPFPVIFLLKGLGFESSSYRGHYGSVRMPPFFPTHGSGTIADTLAQWLLTNNDASCAFVSDRKHLTKALGGDELHVYNNEHSTTGLVTDYRDWQVGLGRRFRALKIWFVLRTYGKDGLQRCKPRLPFLSLIWLFLGAIRHTSKAHG